MSDSTNEIERQIVTLYNVVPGPHPRGHNPVYPVNAELDIRRWLESLGVDSAKVVNMRVPGVQNAYSAGRDWVRRNLVGTPFTPGREFRRHKGVGQMDLGEGEVFAPGEIVGMLGEQGYQNAKSEPTPLPEPNLDAGVQERFGSQLEAKIAAAADQVIGKRLIDAETRLKRETQKAVVDAVASEMEKVRINVTEETKTKITDIASEAAIQAAIKFLEDRVPPKAVRRLAEEPRHEAFERIFFWLALKRHVYIVGPHGTGKTHLFRQLAEALDLKYFPIGQTLTKYELSGHKGPTGEYIGTLLRDAIETGGFVGIDEGDTWAAAAMVFLNTPLANGYCSFPDRVVEVHKDFVCAIAANTWGHGATLQYQGRNPLDAASLDRFAFEEVDYDEKLEIQLYGETPWTQYCHRVRKVARELRIYEAAPSMRGIEMGNLALASGGDPDFVQKSVLWKGLAPDTVAKIKSQAGTFGKVNIREVA